MGAMDSNPQPSFYTIIQITNYKTMPFMIVAFSYWQMKNDFWNKHNKYFQIQMKPMYCIISSNGKDQAQTFIKV